MGKDTPRRTANRLGRTTKKKATKLGVSKVSIVKAKPPREIRDAARKLVEGDEAEMMDADGSTAAGATKKTRPGKQRRKAQRKLNASKKAARAHREKRKHIN